MHLSGRRWWIAVGTVVLVAGASTTVWAVTRSSSSSAAASTTTLVAATRGTIQQTVASTGTIEPAEQEDLAFPVSGTVTKVQASVGQTVAKGAVLAQVSTADLQSTVDQAQASVTAAQQQVTAVAGTTATQEASAAAQLASAQLTLTAAETALSEASLKAPFAGTVAAVTYAVGDVVGSSSSSSSSSTGQSTGQGTAQGSTQGTGQGSTTSSSSSAGITLITTDRWVVNASVGSADLAQLTKGMQVQITPSGATQKVFGTVSSIGIVSTATSGASATFPVIIAVTGNPTGLYSGASADVSFIVKSVDNVLTVPTLALHTVDSKTVVYRSVSGKRVVTPVTVGTSYGASTQITAGVTVGDKVEVTLGAFGARTGVRRNTGTTGGGFGGETGGGFGGGTGGGFGGGTFQGAP